MPLLKVTAAQFHSKMMYHNRIVEEGSLNHVS